MKLLQNVWYSGTIVDFDERDRVVASGATPEIAAHIVRCVNAHDDLVRALRAWVESTSLANETGSMRPVYELAKDALAKAKGS